MVRAIEIVVDLRTKEVTEKYPPVLDEFWGLAHILEITKRDIPVEEQIAQMDAAGN